MASSRVAVLVTSCEKYASTTVPLALESLVREGLSLEDVFVVVGQSAEERDGNFNGAASFWRRWANMDDNGLIWAVQEDGARRLEPYEWVFYMHDTCEAAPGFREGLRACVSEFAGRGTEALRIHAPFSMSMGFYRVAGLQRVRSEVLGAVNYDATEGAILRVKSKVEDRVFRLLESAVLPNEHAIVERDARRYGTTTPRIVEEWRLPHLFKYKANHGQLPEKILL